MAKELKGRGYDLGDVDPAQMEAEDLMDMVLNDKEAKFDSYCPQRPCYFATASRRWRLGESRPWVVFFSILGPFGPRRETALKITKETTHDLVW